MRDDVQPMTTNDLEAPLDDGRTATLPPPRRSGATILKVPALLVLVTGTCWVVASLLTVWLVPPYLVALGWILFPSAGSIPRPGWGKRDQAVATESLALDPVRDRADGSGGGGSPSSTAGSPPLGADPELNPDSPGPTATATAKPKRARSRSRKVKPPADAVEVAPATWVEVGPGKFVRVETPSAATANGPHLAVEPERIAAAEAEADPADGSAPPDLAILPDLDQELSTADSLAGSTLEGADAVVATPNEVEAPAEALAGSLADPVADPFDARTVPEAPNLINPTADGTAPQVGVDKEPDQRIDQPAEAHATALHRDPEPDPWVWEASALLVDSTDAPSPDEPTTVASGESAEIFDSGVEDDREGREAASLVSLEVGCGSGIASEKNPEASSGNLDVSGPLLFVPLTQPRRARVESSRSTYRRAPRGFRRREDRLAGASTNARRFIRRVVGRSRQISRTSQPRSPPATL